MAGVPKYLQNKNNFSFFFQIESTDVPLYLRMGLKQNTSLAAPGALAHRLQNPKWPLGGPKMADGVKMEQST